MQTNWTIDGVTEALTSKKISARELAADYYKRIEARDPELNAYLTLSKDRALAQADRVDALIAGGKPLPPLAGVPMAIKDVISTRGVRSTCGSRILETYTPPYDATAVERLDRARTRPGRIEWGLGRGGGRRPGGCRARHRHRRLDSPARCAVRNPRADAQL